MYTRKNVVKLTGSEQFSDHTTQPFTVLDFWQYGFSNLNSNILRGVLAEFLVESALRDQKDIDIRNPWGDWDVEYKDKKIEVKSCSYLQDWDQSKLSTVQWSGFKAKSLYWSSAVSEFQKDATKAYKADVYVLALLDHQETATLDILNLSQWCFYVLSRETLATISSNRSSISLALLKRRSIEPVGFNELKQAIASI